MIETHVHFSEYFPERVTTESVTPELAREFADEPELFYAEVREQARITENTVNGVITVVEAKHGGLNIIGIHTQDARSDTFKREVQGIVSRCMRDFDKGEVNHD